MDSLEKEDAFYLNDQGRLRKQTGYYIYYDRNENMQNYIQSRSETEEKILNPIEAKDREVLTRVRNQVTKAERRKKKNLMPQVVSFIFATGMLAIGITIMNNYDKMRKLEMKLEQLNLTMNQGQQEENLTLNAGIHDSAYLETGENISPFTEEMKDTGENSMENSNIAVMEGESENNLTESNETVLETNSEEVIETMSQNYYYVEEGDTLLSISLKMYQSEAYVKDIKEANQLEDENYIKIGQKLILPSVQ